MRQAKVGTMVLGGTTSARACLFLLTQAINKAEKVLVLPAYACKECERQPRQLTGCTYRLVRVQKNGVLDILVETKYLLILEANDFDF